MEKTKRAFKMLCLAQRQNALSDLTNTQSDLEVSMSPETTPVMENSWQETRLEDNNVGAAIKNLLEECSLTEEVLSGEVLFDKAADISFNATDKSIFDTDKLDKTPNDVLFLEDELEEEKIRNNENILLEPENQILKEVVPADETCRADEGAEDENHSDFSRDEPTEIIKVPEEDSKAGENDHASALRRGLGSEEAEDTTSYTVSETEEEDTDDNRRDKTVERKRKKKRLSNPAEWKYNNFKRKREMGLDYNGRRGNEFKVHKSKKFLKTRCHCTKKGTQIKCFSLCEEDRQRIFAKFWELSWPEKRVYVTSRVLKCATKRARNRKNDTESQRSVSFCYFLNKKSEQIRVCKTMFCNTLGISLRTISDWIKKGTTSPDINKDAPLSGNKEDNTPRKGLRFEEEKQHLNKFFEALPKLESHYCRKSTTKLYLEPHFKTKSELYSLYKDDWCVKNNIRPLSIATFSNTFEDMNLSLFSPKKDECDLCVGFRTKNIDESVFNEHVLKKDEARMEKERDKNSENRVFTMDLQSVLLSPKSNVSALYYRTKLIVHNFTIFDLHSKNGYCFIWHEGEGELTANCFATIVCKFLSTEIIPQLKPQQKIILFSDGCNAQNRNATMANALLNLAVTSKVCIVQKYLEKGHTQMECDSMHSTIERKLKGRIINVPADYIPICKSARKHPKPYIVNYLNHTFFLNLSKVNLLKSIRPGFKSGDPTVRDLRALKYKPNGKVDYKLRHSDSFQELPVRPSSKSPTYWKINSLPALYKGPLQIKKEKYEHLMFLKQSMESDYHSFYDNLSHE